MSLLIGAATVLLLTATADVDPDLETVCAAPTGQTPRVGGVSIRDDPRSTETWRSSGSQATRAAPS
jgi:hypothetical protein